MPHSITVVIPTFNRPDQLARVLQHIFESDVDNFDEVEVIVVDDGSEISPRSVVENLSPKLPFRAVYLYQENSGPAEARNNGFRNSQNEIVLFIDDDILVLPDLIKKHHDAHIEMPGSVICGQSPYVVPTRSDAEYQYLDELANLGHTGSGTLARKPFERVEIVASGNISVERSLFVGRDVYASGLLIPVGEEYELSAYLASRNIPVYTARTIKGWHLQPPTISDSCKQNYKYGMGIAELAIKRPDVLTLEAPRHLWETNRPIEPRDSFALKTKKLFRRSLSNDFMRRRLLFIAQKVGRILPRRIRNSLYRQSLGSFLNAGVRDGIVRFKVGI